MNQGFEGAARGVIQVVALVGFEGGDGMAGNTSAATCDGSGMCPGCPDQDPDDDAAPLIDQSPAEQRNG